MSSRQPPANALLVVLQSKTVFSRLIVPPETASVANTCRPGCGNTPVALYHSLARLELIRCSATPVARSKSRCEAHSAIGPMHGRVQLRDGRRHIPSSPLQWTEYPDRAYSTVEIVRPVLYGAHAYPSGSSPSRRTTRTARTTDLLGVRAALATGELGSLDRASRGSRRRSVGRRAHATSQRRV